MPTDFYPDYVSPPGDTIKDLMEENGWSLHDLSSRANTSEWRLKGLLNGELHLANYDAIGLEGATGVPAKFWKERERQYRQGLDRMAVKKAGARIPKVGYQIVGRDLPSGIQIDDDNLWSVECPWDYFGNARFVCSHLKQPAIVINKHGNVVYRNAAARSRDLKDVLPGT